MEYNGSAMIAMAGKNCVCIGSDLAFGVQMQHIAQTFKVFQITDKILLGITGLLTDCTSFYQLVRYHVAQLKLQEGRTIQPKSFIHMVGFLLYSKRFVLNGFSPKCLDIIILLIFDSF
jgi:20S proteasome subunit beta 3